MTRPRRQRARAPEISDCAHAFLTDQPPPPDDDRSRWERYFHQYFPDRNSGFIGPHLCELWQQHGDAVLADWIAEHPGTRPAAWWRWSAPRAPAEAFPPRLAGNVPELRKRVDAEEDLDGVELVAWGIPLPCHEDAIYEPQAVYLEARGLLLAGERKRLAAADFEPQAASSIATAYPTLCLAVRVHLAQNAASVTPA